MPHAVELGDTCIVVAEVQSELIKPTFVGRKRISKYRGRVVLLGDQLDHQVAGLGVGGGNIEP